MRTIPMSYPLQADAYDEFYTPQVIAIGYFDGVHLGHQEVIGAANRISLERGIPCSIMTFDPHPREILGKSQYARYLAPLADKLELFEQLGVDQVYVVRFDLAFSAVSPEQFAHQMLKKLQPQAVVVGFDFTFGRHGSGTVETLRELGRPDFEVHVVKPYHLQGEKVSSTLIREHLHLGQPEKAAELLGRPYRVRGTVAHGDKRGRTIGFPTANVETVSQYVMPRRGVYAVRVSLPSAADPDTLLPGVANIGVKPTFGGEERETLEVHLFDFADSIYEQPITVHFERYIREERKFAGLAELTAQIAEDAATAKRLLHEAARPR